MAQTKVCWLAFSPITVRRSRFSPTQNPLAPLATWLLFAEQKPMDAGTEPSTSCAGGRGIRLEFLAPRIAAERHAWAISQREPSQILHRCLEARSGTEWGWLRPIELTTVGRRVHAHEEGVGEANRRRKAEESCNKKKNLLKTEWLDTD